MEAHKSALRCTRRCRLEQSEHIAPKIVMDLGLLLTRNVPDSGNERSDSMPFSKKTFVDNQTIIDADTLNVEVDA